MNRESARTYQPQIDGVDNTIFGTNIPAVNQGGVSGMLA